MEIDLQVDIVEHVGDKLWSLFCYWEDLFIVGDVEFVDDDGSYPFDVEFEVHDELDLFLASDKLFEPVVAVLVELVTD